MLKFLFTFLLLSTIASADPKIRVSVIDLGLDITDPRFSYLLCDNGKSSIDLTNTTLKDVDGHGTHVVGLIKDYAKNSNYCLIIIKYFLYGDEDLNNSKRFKDAIHIAERENSTFVNISSGGGGFDETEKSLLQSRKDVTFIVSAGNDGITLSDKNCYYPACYNLSNVIVVGSLGKNNKCFITSNRGNRVKAWEVGEKVFSTLPDNKWGFMSGTSMATAIRTGKLIYERSHH